MPRRHIDDDFFREVRLAALTASDGSHRKRIVNAACKRTGMTYGGLMKKLNLGLRKRPVPKKQTLEIERMNKYGEIVWQFVQEHTRGEYAITTTQALKHLKTAHVIPANVTRRQIYASIHRQGLKSLSEPVFKQYELENPLDMVQVDFSRSLYIETTSNEEVLRIRQPDYTRKEVERLWLGVAIDDASRVAYARYYPSSGESARMAQLFIVKAFSKKERVNKTTGEVVTLQLLQGMPSVIYTDRGPGFVKGSTQKGLARLGLKHVVGGNEKDSLNRPLNTSNKKARGKVERLIRTLKMNFESTLYLSLGVGTTLTLKELNDRLKKWLIQYNSALHPTREGVTRWQVFEPTLQSVSYADKESLALFSTTIFKIVQRGQVCVEPGVWCKAPSFVYDKQKIEIIVTEGKYYTLDGNRRIELKVTSSTKRSYVKIDREEQIKEELPTDAFEGITLRAMLNAEVEKLSRHNQNLGTIPQSLKEEVDLFVSASKTRAEIKTFAMSLLAGLAEKSDSTVTSEGEITSEETKVKVKK
jgi:hypothetical protein